VLQGDCVCSSNYPGGACAATSTADGQYGNDEACEVTFSGPVTLEVHHFSIEWCEYEVCDPVTVDGVQYTGTDGPDGVTASSLSFASDGRSNSSGFKICFAIPPPLPPLPPPPPPLLVQSSTGACVLQGDCVCSSNYPGGACAATSTADGQYGNDEACEITFAGPVTLEVHLFDTESCCDAATVDSVQYKGTAGPNGVTASSLSFSSDSSVGGSGFKICFAPAQGQG